MSQDPATPSHLVSSAGGNAEGKGGLRPVFIFIFRFLFIFTQEEMSKATTD
ncbi:hypothetical protein [Nonlabens antarcticus]|uniref:hypothetical protein n=1 Tax=Nonlabens antarcticus TaxID=392714 RepID=UPI00189151C2|nr:hypothetical protein [Nonlabens antarcticus]